MKLSTKVGLLLVPNLRSIARRLEEVEKGLEVAQDWVGWIEEPEGVAALGSPELCAGEAKAAIVESRARLIEVVDELTGRR